MQKKNQKRKINLTEYREEGVATLAALKVDVRNFFNLIEEDIYMYSYMFFIFLRKDIYMYSYMYY